ncbi:MAG: dTDP-4-dehydrorhamnose reductase [Homoserinimonas sp.]|nr:dTDP-4-dehydrorhamnose reductase [Homoserinimonas sp.]
MAGARVRSKRGGAVNTGALQMWAGLESTINRVGDRYCDQSEQSGHNGRAVDDISRFTALEIRKLRYPVLWEKVAPRSLTELQFNETDERLSAIRDAGVDPIVGLLHHGSGPRYTSLTEPGFPHKLAAYAARVAERFPWVQHYTPVNEPLTTARFSGLYGVWYPHGHDDRTFVRALYNEVKGTALAMRAIREVNSDARLVQTEDVGRASGTPPLQYQVDFENERRWLSFDLLRGAVDADHALYRYLIDAGGLTEAELVWLAQNPCSPDVIGINHYPLSNRFLDHRLELYPEEHHGGNGRDVYADVGAVDTGQVDPPTVESVLRDAWGRYDRPLAVTEAHIAGGREAQLRWLDEVWQSAEALRSEGAPVVAVTAWSLLGSFGWNTLCTDSKSMHYESGLFDVRWTPPRATALAAMTQELAVTGHYRHPLLDRPGYWHHGSRVLFAPRGDVESESNQPPSRSGIIILGGRSLLARAFEKVCQRRGIHHVMLGEPDAHRDGSAASYRQRWAQTLDVIGPWAVIDAHGDQPRPAQREAELADECASREIAFLTFSGDLVFGYNSEHAHQESDPLAPDSAAGVQEAAAEAAVLRSHRQALVVRTGPMFGAGGDADVVEKALQLLASNAAVEASDDVLVSPTYVPDLVGSCLDLLIDGVTGVLHLTNGSAVTPYEWFREAAKAAGVDERRVQARRPYATGTARNRALVSYRAQVLPPLADALLRYAHKRRRDAVS